MKRFDINEYAGRFAMHCKTEDEAETFCNYLHDKGKQWCDGKSYKDTKYHSDNNGIMYYFNNDAWSSVAYAKGDPTTITLEFSNFDWSKEFIKADLKTGDVVLRRNGDVEIVIKELNVLVRPRECNRLDDINEDLTHSFLENGDIIAVRRPITTTDCQFAAFKEKRGTLVYERKEVEEMTLEQVCKLLGKEIKIIK